MERLGRIAAHTAVCTPCAATPAEPVEAAPLGLLPGCTSKPAIVTDPKLALPEIQANGACIFQADVTDDETDAEIRDRVELMAREIFAGHLDMAKDPVPAPNPVKDQRTEEKFKAASYVGRKHGVHNDGWDVYGEMVPDYFILFCAKSADEGGESWLIDGYAMEEAMPPATRHALRTAPVRSKPPQERQISSITGGPMWSADWEAPIAQETAAGRLMLRMAGADTPVAEVEGSAEVHTVYQDAAQAAADVTPRFKLERGQGIILDNYRMFHGRDPYFDPERRMWRVWVWTDQRRFRTLPINCRW
jgi:alpha-ketoglutarate-dependent taurine dioxygenase